MWHIIHKTINRVTGEYFYGIHFTNDMFYGAEGQTDFWIGSGARLDASLKEHGRRVFVVQNLFCSAEKEVVLKKWKEMEIHQYYSDPLCLNGMKALTPREKMIRERADNLAAIRRTKHWINNGTETKYVDRTAPIPEGWSEGRAYAPRKKRK